MDPELVSEITYFKEKLGTEWETVKAIIQVNTPKHFPEGVADDIKLFEWASNFVNTRAFGWGVPHLTLVPLVDMVNHTDLSKLSLDLFHSKLHLADNKIYMHEYLFEPDS